MYIHIHVYVDRHRKRTGRVDVRGSFGGEFQAMGRWEKSLSHVTMCFINAPRNLFEEK